MKAIATKDFQSAVSTMKNNIDGVVYQTVDTLDDGRDLCLVFGWADGYDEGDASYQIKQGKTIYTLCAKLAVNIDDLQADFEASWYMPWNEMGDVVDTCEAVEGGAHGLELQVDYYNAIAKDIIENLNNGKLEVH